MQDYPGDLLPFSTAYSLAPLPHLHERVILDPTAPSAVRVLGKSMHVLAAGWTLAAGWLWIAMLQQHQLRHEVPPRLLAMDNFIGGAVPALVLAAIGWLFARVAGRAPYAALEGREWRHAVWWSIVPNAMLFLSVWVMLHERS